KDLNSRFLRINKFMVSYFGLADPAEAIGKSDFDFFTEEHARPAYEDEQAIIRSGRPVVGLEEKETWLDARVRGASTTKMPFRDKDGTIIGTFGVSRDITRLKQAEAERNLLRLLLDNLPDPVYVKDTDGRFRITNRAQARALGAAGPEEVVG